MNSSLKQLFLAMVLIPSFVFSQATCPANISETAGTDMFDISTDGEALHLDSNLIFMRCSLGQTWDGSDCVGDPTAYNWQEALNISLDTSFNDSNNWRLPNVKELAQIIEYSCAYPSINETIFPNTSVDDYWTSTPAMLDEDSVWVISFTNGSNSMKLKSRSLFVRLVRTNID